MWQDPGSSFWQAAPVPRWCWKRIAERRWRRRWVGGSGRSGQCIAGWQSAGGRGRGGLTGTGRSRGSGCAEGGGLGQRWVGGGASSPLAPPGHSKVRGRSNITSAAGLILADVICEQPLRKKR